MALIGSLLDNNSGGGIPVGDLKIISGDLFFQVSKTLAKDDYRLNANGVYFDIERWTGTEWETQSRIGGSFFVKNFIEIIKESTNGAVYLSDSEGTRNLVASTNFSRGTLVGDIHGDTYLTGADSVFKSTVEGPAQWYPIQADNSMQYTGTSSYVEFSTGESDGFKITKVGVDPVNITENTPVQLQIYLQSDLSNPVWQNVTTEELEGGIGDIVDVSTGEITLNIPFSGDGYTDLRFVINTIEPITLKGSTDDGTNICYKVYFTGLRADDIAAFQPWKDGNHYYVGDKIWQERDIFICNTESDQTTSFDSNRSKWDSFSVSSETSKFVQSTGLLEGGFIYNGSTSTNVSWGFGKGKIADYSTTTSPNENFIEWEDTHNIEVENIGVDGTTYFGYDASGSVVQRLSVSAEDLHNIIFFGSVLHIGGEVITTTPDPLNLAYDVPGSLTDFLNFVVGPANISGNKYSASGITPDNSNLGGGTLDICYAEPLDRYVAVGRSGSTSFHYSSDAVDWTPVTMADEGYDGVCYSNDKGLFVAVGYGETNNIQYSSDGINWTAVTVPNGGLRKVCYSNTLGMFVAVGTAWNVNVQYSSDAINWSQIDVSTNLWDIAYSEFIGIFVAVGTNSTNNIQYSYDLISWVGVTVPDIMLQSVCYSEWLGRFVAVGQAEENNIVYSDDGINWTAVTIDAGSLGSVTYSMFAQKFVAVGTHSIIVSTDGSEWEHYASFEGYEYSSVLSVQAHYIVIAASPADTNNILFLLGDNKGLKVSDGEAFIIGSNFRNNTAIPNNIPTDSLDIVDFFKVYNGPGSSVIYDGSPTIEIDADNYEYLGEKKTVSAGYWTIQRIFRSRTGSTLVAYGQEQFSTQALALESLVDEQFVEKSPLPSYLYRTALVVQQGFTDLRPLAKQAKFIDQPSFRRKNN